jgi:hypothetical protein
MIFELNLLPSTVSNNPSAPIRTEASSSNCYQPLSTIEWKFSRATGPDLPVRLQKLLARLTRRKWPHLNHEVG